MTFIKLLLHPLMQALLLCINVTLNTCRVVILCGSYYYWLISVDDTSVSDFFIHNFISLVQAHEMSLKLKSLLRLLRIRCVQLVNKK